MLRVEGSDKVWSMYSGGRNLEHDQIRRPVAGRGPGGSLPHLSYPAAVTSHATKAGSTRIDFKGAGVAVEEICCAGQPHEFMNLGFPASGQAYVRIGDWLRAVFG